MKILLCHMWMVIGGAETHIVELSRELAARGHDVTVASNGGVYVDALTKGGVKHFTVPLHTKKPAAVIESYKKLKELIRREKFDIVHAHSRIPAFVCGMLARRMGFRFITTTHFVFKVNSLLARLSDWGDHTFAVSCDIKQYLMDKYNVPSDNVTLTINGIDTVKFHKDIDTSATEAALSLAPDRFRILHVSRIDDSTVRPSLLLCESAEELARRIPNLEIVIVGGGNAFEQLSKKAAKANDAIGREVIRLTGPRTDIAELCASADAFVGVSRAALEAMSCERPTVLVGPLGYSGIMREEILEIAKATNFCFRGQPLAETSDVTRDLLELYSMSKKERAELGALGRRVVLEGYSVARMADDHLNVYQKMTPYQRYSSGDVIISGYYGFDNIGDDSLLATMIEGIKTRAPETRITVLSKNPKKLARTHCIRTINRFNLPMVAHEMRRAKLLISGGGSLLQDGTSKKSLFYYITIMRMAKKRGLKLMLYANGLGPLGNRTSRSHAAAIIESADIVTLRESASERLAREIGVKTELTVSADPAFLVEPSPELWCDHIRNREGITGGYFIVSIKEGNNFGARSDGSLLDIMAADLKKISDESGLAPLIVPMHENRDLAVSHALCEKLGCGKVVSGLTAAEICGLMRNARFVIGMRLHMLIFAAAMGVPMVGISYDPKIDAFIQYMGEMASELSHRALDVRSLADGQIKDAVDRLMAQEQDYRAAFAKLAPEMRRLAKEDCARACALLKDGKVSCTK